MRAAEKYAELEAAGLERPRCECHGQPMQWSKARTYSAGGRWLCIAYVKERNKRNYLRHHEEKLERKRRYRKENREAYLESQRRSNIKRRQDPEWRKRKTIYDMYYHHRKKRERYDNLSLIDQGLPRGDHGQEAGSRRDRAA